MNTILVTAGVAALLTAVIGGGLNAFNIEIPKVTSRGIRVALGFLGIGFLIVVILPQQKSRGKDPTLTRYQRQVAATCDNLRELGGREGYGPPVYSTEGRVAYDHDTVVSHLRSLIEAIDRRLDVLFARPVPVSLRESAQIARRRADSYVRAFRVLLRKFGDALPTHPTSEEIEAAAARYQNQLDDVGVRLSDAMTQLADRECRRGAPTLS
jgi:hypothetical protein